MYSKKIHLGRTHLDFLVYCFTQQWNKLMETMTKLKLIPLPLGKRNQLIQSEILQQLSHLLFFPITFGIVLLEIPTSGIT